jgi:hypothetical protein
VSDYRFHGCRFQVSSSRGSRAQFRYVPRRGYGLAWRETPPLYQLQSARKSGPIFRAVLKDCGRAQEEVVIPFERMSNKNRSSIIWTFGSDVHYGLGGVADWYSTCKPVIRPRKREGVKTLAPSGVLRIGPSGPDFTVQPWPSSANAAMIARSCQ